MTIEPPNIAIYLLTAASPEPSSVARVYAILANSAEDAIRAVKGEVPDDHRVALTNHGLPVPDTIERLRLRLNEPRLLPPVG
jgi:hypothetical protein